VTIPFFTLFFHPSDPLTFFNYAIPNVPKFDDIGDALKVMRTEFSKRNRRARLEFIQEYNPQLVATLRPNDFIEEARQCLMICTAEKYSPVSNTSELVVEEITEKTKVGDAQKFLAIQRKGFGGKETEAVTGIEAKHFLRMLGKGRAFVGFIEENPIAVGMFSEPHNGISELAGLATLEAYRRQGVATAITTLAVKRAFDQGVEVVFLSAADEKAGRVYQRVGFENYATVLAYINGK